MVTKTVWVFVTVTVFAAQLPDAEPVAAEAIPDAEPEATLDTG